MVRYASDYCIDLLEKAGKGACSRATFEAVKQVYQGLNSLDLYFKILREEMERCDLKKEAWGVAETVHQLYFGRDRFDTYNAMSMAMRKHEKDARDCNQLD